MEYEDFPRSNKALLSETSTREQFLIELLDLLKEHHQVALASLKYKEGLAMTEVEIKLRHAIDILNNVYDKYGVEASGSFGFYRDEVDASHRYRTSDMDRERIAGDTDKPSVDDATGQS
jgi:hypothetical protein